MNENLLKNLIEIIRTGSPQEVKNAQKEIAKFWHDFYIPKRKEGKKAFSIFLEEIKKFDEIQDIDHKTYFINTLKRILSLAMLVLQRLLKKKEIEKKKRYMLI